MSFTWPLALLLLLVSPLLLALYIWVLRRKRKFAVRYASLALIRAALPRRSRWRQHLPFALFWLGLTALLFSAARPAAVVDVPLSRTTMILALDVSRSMCATDVDPNRLTVAQAAALSFIDEQADGTRVGIVAFAGFAELIVPPTNDKDLLRQAVVNLTTSLGTAIGSATLKSIDAIALINEAVAPSGVDLSDTAGAPAGVQPIYQPDIIVLLTDGANSQGPPPLIAAEQAVDRGVRVYTIGFGTTNPTNMVCTQEQLGSDVFGGFGGGFGGPGFGGNFRRFLVIDEPTLMGIAEMTGGEYFRAENAEQLQAIFHDLPAEIVLQPQHVETSAGFVALAALLIVAALGLSLWWRRYP